MCVYIYIFNWSFSEKSLIQDLGRILAFFSVLPERTFSLQKLMQYHRNGGKHKGSVVSMMKEDDLILVITEEMQNKPRTWKQKSKLM